MVKLCETDIHYTYSIRHLFPSFFLNFVVVAVGIAVVVIPLIVVVVVVFYYYFQSYSYLIHIVFICLWYCIK